MKFWQRFIWIVFSMGMGIGMHACSPSPPAPTLEVLPPTITSTFTPVPGTLAPPQPSSTPALTATPFVSPTSTIFPPPGTQGEHFLFTRPIDIWVDFTYRYGSTQNGTRATHHGSDLVVECGLPVQAGADGEVVVAGGDWQDVYGPYQSFYGNLVVLRHEAFSGRQEIFTLYGHLSQVNVEVGDFVSRGDVLGEVGFTGAAIGCHLHFEVRLGENNYASTRNPELWMLPNRDEAGTFNGAIAGQLMGLTGYPIPGVDIEIQRLDEDGKVIHTIYTTTYADQSVNGDDEWKENFAVGNLAPGQYQVQFIANGLEVYKVEVKPGQVALIYFQLGE